MFLNSPSPLFTWCYNHILLSIFILYIFYSLAIALYNITLHPLAKVPGPKLRGAFHFVHYWDTWTGKLVTNAKELHDCYGHTVRIAPNRISFNNAESWQEIYMQRQGKKPLPKDQDFYNQGVDDTADIISANDYDHARIRRLLNHAFSESALRAQESLITHHITHLIQKLQSKISDSPNKECTLNIVRWFNFTTFDLIGDLCFAESFDALKTEKYNSWIANIFVGIKFARVFIIARAYPIIGIPLMGFIKLFPVIEKAKLAHLEYTKTKTARRLDTETTRRDFISYILHHNKSLEMTREEITITSSSIIVAGSETSATLLSGAIFHLLKNPTILQKLTHAIRTTFPNQEDLTFQNLANMKYLTACIQESLRMYPPVPGLLPRITEKNGMVINGYWIPGNTCVGVNQLAANFSASNFASPSQFIPSRWLDDAPSDFKSDKRNAMQPFSVGPRNCIGQTLAQAEIRAILAQVLWNFDFELCDQSRNWDVQRVFILWDKPELIVKLRPRKI